MHLSRLGTIFIFLVLEVPNFYLIKAFLQCPKCLLVLLSRKRKTLTSFYFLIAIHWNPWKFRNVKFLHQHLRPTAVIILANFQNKIPRTSHKTRRFARRRTCTKPHGYTKHGHWAMDHTTVYFGFFMCVLPVNIV